MWDDDEWEDGGWAPYVPVAERRRNAERLAAQRRKQGRPLDPIEPFRRRELAATRWGRAWCDNAEAFSSWSNRLDRGKRYLRNGSVFHLEVGEGRVEALVSGSDIYTVTLEIAPLPSPRWEDLKVAAQGRVASVLDLLQGRLSEGIMGILAAPRTGLFPTPKEVGLDCTCPDDTAMCKHVAAVFYGVGVRLDERPELLFRLRGVDQRELTSEATSVEALVGRGSDRALAAGAEDLGALFGIDLGEASAPPAPVAEPVRKAKERGVPKRGRGASVDRGRPKLPPLPPRLPRKLTPALLLEWGIPRSTFQNWVGDILERTDQRGVYRPTREARARIVAARARLEDR